MDKSVDKYPRLLTNNYISIKKCKHGYMMYNLNDLFVGRALDLYGEWCEAELDCLNQLIQPGDVVVDIGANIGTHTMFFSNKVTNSGAVYAIEPQRVIYQLLSANIVMNCMLNVIPLQMAVGEKRGNVIIPILDPTKQQNFAALKIEEHQMGERVNLISIDNLNLKKCNLIKIDVEGMEDQVLLGAKETIHKYRPFLFVENNNTHGSPDTVQILNDFGYQCWWHIANYYNPENYFNNGKNVFKNYHPEANMICVPKEHTINITGFEPVVSINDNWTDALNRINDTKK